MNSLVEEGRSAMNLTRRRCIGVDLLWNEVQAVIYSQAANAGWRWGKPACAALSWLACTVV